MKKVLLNATVLALPLMVATYSNISFAKTAIKNAVSHQQEDFNPFDEQATEKLKAMDAEYQRETGLNAVITVPQSAEHAEGEDAAPALEEKPNVISTDSERASEDEQQIPRELIEKKCRRDECRIFVDVQRSRQVLNLYKDGQLVLTTRTSTGRAGFDTPNFDTNPNGRIYQVYSSKTYPGYNNMPFAVFIQGGFAIHGAPGKEDAQLGRPASHGCVRVRTSVAQQINKIISEVVVADGRSTKNVWITVRD